MTPATLKCKTCCRQAGFEAWWCDVTEHGRTARRIRAWCLDCGTAGDWLPVSRFAGVAKEPRPKETTPSLFDLIEGEEPHGRAG